MDKREFTLRYHLTYNLYPSVTDRMIPYCIRAIDLAKAGEIDSLITFPNGAKITAGEIIEDLNLGFYLQ